MAAEASQRNGLTVKQERAIVALLNEQTMARVATAAQVGERTLYRWLSEPGFTHAYRKARREAFSQAIALTQRYAPLAVNTVAQVMMDPAAPHHAKVRGGDDGPALRPRGDRARRPVFDQRHE